MKRPKSTILKKGDQLNDTYKVICFIGMGAFGEVYRVKHKYLGVQVIKVFKTDYVLNTDISIVINEALVLSKLTHKNIVRVFEANTFDHKGETYHFITMEFISGESLAQLMKRKISLSVGEALSIQVAILTALEEVHTFSPPIIHRDISPDNILLSYSTDRPRALLSDFGLAQSFDQLSGMADAAGKYLYLAPECYWNVYLPTSDVFSAGVVLYRMLTGTYPWNYDFEGLTSEDPSIIMPMIAKSRRERPKNPSLYNENCSENLDRITLKALSVDLEKRYANGQVFLKDIYEEFEFEPNKTNEDLDINHFYY